jgi:predicted DNA-binding protein
VSLNSSIPVRFDQDTTDRLKAISERTGLPLSNLVRMATEQYLDKVEKTGSVNIALKESVVPYRSNSASKQKAGEALKKAAAAVLKVPHHGDAK